MPELSPQDIDSRLRSITGWKIVFSELVKTFSFRDFLTAIDFVNQVAKAAEDMGHHPDIDIRYDRVRIALSTHDAGGITEMDFNLAAEIEKLA
jgi:4a-hydroxytetrahydrobiopterin dehydratase